jgi:hypothetical protein
MLAQPCCQGVRLAAGQQCHRPSLVEVHQHGAVGVPLAQRPVVHAKGGWCCGVGHGRPPDEAQQGVTAGSQSELAAKAHAGRAAERQAHGREPPGKARRPTRPGCCDIGQTFGKQATLAFLVVAEQAPDAQKDGDGILAPGQVGERPLVAAVDALGLPGAERAAGHGLARPEVDGDDGLDGIKRPGFEPDVGRIRQQA